MTVLQLIAAALALVAAFALVLVVLHLLALRGRALLPGRLLAGLGAVVSGALVGLTALLGVDGSISLLIALAIGVWLGRWFVRDGRLQQMGLFLTGAAAPWTALLGWFVLARPAVIVPIAPQARPGLLVLALATMALGIALARAGARGRQGVPPRGADRVRALGRAVERAQAIGPVAAPPMLGIGAGILAALTADLALHDIIGTPLRQIVASLAFVAAAIPVWLLALPPRVREAQEALAWIVAREQERWQGHLGGRRPVVTLRSAGRLADGLPDTDALRPLRAELLAIAQRLDEAQQTIDRIPQTFPEDRFDRAALVEYLAFLRGGADAREPMRRVLSELDGDARLQAEGQLAVADSRRATDAGEDVLRPLALFRRQLGNRAMRYQFGYSTGVAMLVLLIGLVASVSVSVSSFFLR